MHSEDEIKAQLRELTQQVQSLRKEIRGGMKNQRPRPPEEWTARDHPDDTRRSHS